MDGVRRIARKSVGPGKWPFAGAGRWFAPLAEQASGDGADLRPGLSLRGEETLGNVQAFLLP